jgi:hypothetical protein
VSHKRFEQEIEFFGEDRHKMQAVFSFIVSRLPEPSFIEDRQGNVMVRSGPHEASLVLGNGEDVIRIRSKEVHDEKDCESCEEYIGARDSLDNAKTCADAQSSTIELMSVAVMIAVAGFGVVFVMVFVFLFPFLGR